MAIEGNDRILLIKQGDTFLPIACLTSNGFQEQTQMFETTTRASGGWETSLPDNQSYNLSFSGVNQATGLSVETLQILKRNRILIIWGIGVSGNVVEQGKGYITEISVNDEVNQDSTFSGSIQGVGEPERLQTAIGVDIDDFLATFDGNLISD